MTHKEHAEKVWKAARDAAQCEDIDGDEKEAISIIAAALKKQREACAEAAYRCITEE